MTATTQTPAQNDRQTFAFVAVMICGAVLLTAAVQKTVEMIGAGPIIASMIDTHPAIFAVIITFGPLAAMLGLVKVQTADLDRRQKEGRPFSEEELEAVPWKLLGIVASSILGILAIALAAHWALPILG